jgi:hypothetical protein
LIEYETKTFPLRRAGDRIDTWDLIDQPDKFNRYVEEETAKFLGGS